MAASIAPRTSSAGGGSSVLPSMDGGNTDTGSQADARWSAYARTSATSAVRRSLANSSIERPSARNACSRALRVPPAPDARTRFAPASGPADGDTDAFPSTESPLVGTRESSVRMAAARLARSNGMSPDTASPAAPDRTARLTTNPSVCVSTKSQSEASIFASSLPNAAKTLSTSHSSARIRPRRRRNGGKRSPQNASLISASTPNPTPSPRRPFVSYRPYAR